MDAIASIFVALFLALVFILAGFFAFALHSAMVESWRGWRDPDSREDPEGPTSLGVALVISTFALAVYVLIALAIVRVINW